MVAAMPPPVQRPQEELQLAAAESVPALPAAPLACALCCSWETCCCGRRPGLEQRRANSSSGASSSSSGSQASRCSRRGSLSSCHLCRHRRRQQERRLQWLPHLAHGSAPAARGRAG